MDSIEKAQRDAQRAKDILEDAIVKDALESMRAQVMNRLDALPVYGHDDEKRRLLDYHQIIRVFETNLKQRISGGEVAELNLRNRSLFNQQGI